MPDNRTGVLARVVRRVKRWSDGASRGTHAPAAARAHAPALTAFRYPRAG